MAVARPRTMMSSACSGSVGMLAPRAMLLKVPSGTMPSVASVPSRAAAAGPTVPSPPATTTSRPSSAAAVARRPSSSSPTSSRSSTWRPPSARTPNSCEGRCVSWARTRPGFRPAAGLTSSRIGRRPSLSMPVGQHRCWRRSQRRRLGGVLICLEAAITTVHRDQVRPR